MSAEPATWGGAARPFGQYRCVAAYDYDGDGRDDLLFGGAAGRLRLFRNRGGWHFDDVTALLGDLPARNNYGGAAWADLDGDGRADLVLGGRATAPVVLRQTDTGGFDDVTAASGVISYGRTLSLNLADFDGDGRTDIYLALLNAPNRLYLNRGVMRFVDEAALRGATDDNVSMGAIATDYDGDGDVDLYLTHDNNRPNLLLANDGRGYFADVAAELGVDVAANGMGVDVADFDGDARADLYVTNLLENNLLLTGTRYPRRYVDEATARAADDRGMGWGVAVADFDHDGRADIYVGNESYFTVDGRERPNVLYRGLPDGTFEDVAAGAAASPWNDFGLASADLDGDGDLDLAIATSGGLGCQVLRNDSPTGNYLAVRTPAINAQLVAYAGGRKFWDETHAGSGFAGQSAPHFHVGLGDIAGVDSVVVKMPTGARLAFRDVAPNRTYSLTEAGTLEEFVLGPLSSADREAGFAVAGLSVAPNPTSGAIAVGFGESRNWTYRVLDGLSNSLRRGACSTRRCTIDLHGLRAGAYIVVVRDAATGKSARRIILRQ